MATPTLEAHLRDLLGALRGLGRVEVATAFEREFTARGWEHLDLADERRVLESMRSEAPPSPGRMGQVRTAPAAVQESPPQVDRLEPLTGFLPFLDAIRGGRDILLALDALARCLRWERFERQVARLFVSVLGYESHEVDLSERVGQRSTIERLKLVARHGHFQVAVVVLTDAFADTKWSAAAAHYQTCVPLVPHGLLVSFEPGSGAIRFVFRSSEGKLRYRALVGPASLREPDDNLLTWTWRVARLAPTEGDDHSSLQRRLSEQLDLPTAALASDWASIPLDLGASLPGRTLADQNGLFAKSFLQADLPADQRLHWGLSAALRACFPTPLWRERQRLVCQGYEVLSCDPRADEAWRGGTTMACVLRLHLALTTWEGEALPGSDLELRATLPAPDVDGRFVVHGAIACFQPRALRSGAGVREGSPARWAHEPTGILLESWLTLLVETEVSRHLRLLRRRLRRLNVKSDTSAPVSGSLILAALAPTMDDEGQLPLASTAALRRMLSWRDLGQEEVCALTAPAKVPLELPDWACPLLSAASPGGRLVPVLAARLHPCGNLAVPRKPARGRASLRVADVTPGLSGDQTEQVGPPEIWVGPGLGAWAHRVNTGLQQPERLPLARRLSVTTVLRSAALPTGTAWTRPGLLPSTWRRVRVAQDLLADPTELEKAKPRLLLGEGQRVRGMCPWLDVPETALTPAQRGRILAIDDIYRAIAHAGRPAEEGEGGANESSADGRRQIHLPVGGLRVVLAAGVSARRSRRGVQLGWRAWIELAELDEISGALVDASGSWYRLVPWTDDLPWSLEDGEEPDVVFAATAAEDGAGSWISGADGEPAAANPTEDDGVYFVRPPQAQAVLAQDHHHRSNTRGDLRSHPAHDVTAGLSDWREWAALNPEQVTAVSGPILWPDSARARCAELLLTADVALPPELFPVEWARGQGHPRSFSLVSQPFDAVPEAPHPLRDLVSRRWKTLGAPVLLQSSCACGALNGAKWSGRRCHGCRGVVKTRPVRLVGLSWPAIELPCPVLHPWKAEVAAALLGLTGTEFWELMKGWGPVHLRAAIETRLAAGAPLGDGLTRLRGGPGTQPLRSAERARLGLALHRLARLLRTDPTLSTLWLDTVPWPAPGLLSAGLTAGAPEPRTSPLVRHVQTLSAAIDLLQGLQFAPQELLSRQAQVGLQDAVRDLYGTVDEAPGLGNLAAWLRMCWPLARSGLESVSAPGLMSLACELLDDPRVPREPVFAAPLSAEARAGTGPSPIDSEETDELERVRALRIASVDEQKLALFRAASGAGPSRRRRWLKAASLTVPERRDAQVARIVSAVGLPRLLGLMSSADLRWLETRLAAWSGENDATEPERDDWRLPQGQQWARTRPDRPTARVLETAEGGIAVIRPSRPEWVRAEAEDWRRRRAVNTLRDRWWSWLVAVLCETDRAHGAPAESTGSGRVDRAISGLAMALRDGHPGLNGLLDLLEPEGDLKTRRVSDPVGVGERQVLPELVTLVEANKWTPELCELLYQAWSGWYRVEPDAASPMGLRWSPALPVPGARRTVLGANHPAWLALPAVAASIDPVGFCALDTFAEAGAPDAMLRCLGLANPAVQTDEPSISPVTHLDPAAQDIEVERGSPASAPEVLAPSTELEEESEDISDQPTEKEHDVEIRVLTESALSWMERVLWSAR